jgi:hypothetical protein
VPALHDRAIEPSRGAAAETRHPEPEKRGKNRHEADPRAAGHRALLLTFGHEFLPPMVADRG